MEVSDVSESKNGKPFPIEESNDLIVYEPSPLHDSLMLGWWARLLSDGELDKIFTNGMMAVTNFCAAIQLPRHVLFKQREGIGVWYTALITPTFDGAFFDMWCAKDLRATRACLEALEQALTWALDRWPVLIGLTVQEKLLDAHRRLGYTVVGSIPGLWNGRDTFVMHLTKEAFMSRQVHSVRRSA